MITKINQSTPLGREQVGGKAANLNRLYRNDIPIPQAYVVTTDSFLNFASTYNILRPISLLSNTLPLPELKNQALSIQSSILSAPLLSPLTKQLQDTLSQAGFDSLAIRSSVNAEDGTEHSFAGQFESYLNIAPEQVATMIKRCWASCYSGRVMTYCYYNKITPSSLLPAVILQEMLEGQDSGIVFTSTADYQNMLIETCPGNLDELTDGTTSPQQYQINRLDLVQHPQTIPPRLLPIAKHALEIESLLGMPQDIEWISHNNKTTILQTRPLTISLENTI